MARSRPLRSPAFIVGTGRCGSTLLSDALALHPDVLSLSEVFSTLYPFEFSPTEPVSLRRLSDIVLTPRPESDILLRHHLEPPEYLYPVDAGFFSRQSGVPPLAIATVPHLTGETDAAVHDLQHWLAQAGTDELPIGSQFDTLFGHLADVFGGRLWVERSGSSLLYARDLATMFPTARFVHIYRDGRECAVSMSRYSGLRLAHLRHAAAKRRGLDPTTRVAGSVEELEAELSEIMGQPFSADRFWEWPMPTEWFGNMWSIAILFGLGRLRTVTGPIPSLSYEELQSAPAEGLSKLAEYLEIDPGAGDWLRRAVEIVRPPQPPAWRRLPENERIQLEIACRPGLKELNKQRMDEFYALEAPANAGRQRLRSKR